MKRVLSVVTDKYIGEKVENCEISSRYLAAPFTGVHTKVGVVASVAPEVGLTRVVIGYCFTKV